MPEWHLGNKQNDVDNIDLAGQHIVSTDSDSSTVKHDTFTNEKDAEERRRSAEVAAGRDVV